MASHQTNDMSKFLAAMHHVYGNFSKQSSASFMSWNPPPSPDGHRGRYLWTDAFGVCNFLTLFESTRDQSYVTLAQRLILMVHNILGYTRDGTTRLPGASENNPLGGGLRIGKLSAEGRDSDGQYCHYLTMWMFALNRMAKVSGDMKYNDLAIQLVKATHPRFVYQRDGARPRMVWKMSTDLREILVPSEGSLDSVQGYVVYRLIQDTANSSDVLKEEIEEMERVFNHKYDHYSSTDALDLGMAVWTAHWFTEGPEKAPWALNIKKRSLKCINDLFSDNYFNASQNPLAFRLAFREFGTAMGIRCIYNSKPSDPNLERNYEAWSTRAKSVIDEWERSHTISFSDNHPLEPYAHSAINHVMYAAALYPGVFKL